MTDDIMLMGKSPNFLGAWDLYDAPGRSITVTIRSIGNEMVAAQGKEEAVTVCRAVKLIKLIFLNLINCMILV